MMSKKFRNGQIKKGNWTPQVSADEVANSVMKDGKNVVDFVGLYVLKDGTWGGVKSKSKGISDFEMIGIVEQLKYLLVHSN